MSRYLWLTWSIIVFHISVNFLLQERTHVSSTDPVELEIFPFKVWLAQRADIYMFGALILPFCSATALALLMLHLFGSHTDAHLDRLPAVINRNKLENHGRPSAIDRKLDRFLRVAWPLLFIVVTVGGSWHFVTGFFNKAVYTHCPPVLFFDSGWGHMKHFNPFQRDLRYASSDGATYIAGLYPWISVIGLAACTIFALWWVLIWLPSPLLKKLSRK